MNNLASKHLAFRQNAELILASGSPRRLELLQGCGLSFEVLVSGCDEENLAGESPEQMVKRLAEAKARFVAQKHPGAWVLGADTDVVLDGEILGKPQDAQDAEKMLAKIQGREHLVWGGFAILNQARGITHVEAHLSRVQIAPLNERVIRSYVATGEPLDKAGAYAVQGLGAAFISRIEGSYTNVVGLNLEAVLRKLNELGVVEFG
jgi:septum formation protein